MSLPSLGLLSRPLNVPSRLGGWGIFGQLTNVDHNPCHL
jgi:hypothetical protein